MFSDAAMKMSIRNVIYFTGLAVYQLLGLNCGIDMAQAAEPRPRITSVRVGIAGHYKVGCWTPISIDTATTENLENGQVAVTVVDSDAVPTTASAPLQFQTAGNGRPTTVVYTK